MSDFWIRDALPQDEASIIGLIQALNEDGMQYEPYMPGPDAARAYQRELAVELSKNDGFVLLAEVEKTVVGFLAAYDKHDDVAIELEERIGGFISELFVQKEMRKKGIATALLNEAERRFKARGFKRVIVSVVTENNTAMRLYRSNGFGDHVSLLQKRLDT
jgi:ribosomal protein S18 acetylase RimI-like enzyme